MSDQIQDLLADAKRAQLAPSGVIPCEAFENLLEAVELLASKVAQIESSARRANDVAGMLANGIQPD